MRGNKYLFLKCAALQLLCETHWAPLGVETWIAITLKVVSPWLSEEACNRKATKILLKALEMRDEDRRSRAFLACFCPSS